MLFANLELKLRIGGKFQATDVMICRPQAQLTAGLRGLEAEVSH